MKLDKIKDRFINLWQGKAILKTRRSSYNTHILSLRLPVIKL
ncbi:hypothetical protein QPK24_03010 [Paenibacillus polygoni]|uniref:Uncharacterized protein n=1 Tax=Paenibacillus polygoni TaxID=3050112 RepID=A0ABY8X2I6_9BACL|nr:hypothetical protein [Paenibacillus polygoni]WIV19731.1 hypothetical protein QPK24_03010 [Paenibacillus polygoni]